MSSDGFAIEPRQLGILFSPPTLVLEFWDPNKSEMMQRHIELPTLTPLDDAQEAAKIIVKQNASYFAEIRSAQVARLLARLQRGPGLRKEIAKYSGAVASFKRFAVGHPVRDLWEQYAGAGLKYWDGRSEGDELEIVAQQARAGFDAALAGGVTPEALAEGLARAVGRFQLVPQFKPLLAPAVVRALERIGKGPTEPPASQDEAFLQAARTEVVETALKELRLEGVRVS